VIQRDHQVASAVRVGLNQIQRAIVQHHEFCRRLQPLGLQGKVSAYRIACVSRVGGSGIHEIEQELRASLAVRSVPQPTAKPLRQPVVDAFKRQVANDVQQIDDALTVIGKSCSPEIVVRRQQMKKD
jgi:hypothetical protein